MKVVFITGIYLPHIGGIEIYIHEIAQYFVKKNCNVVVIVADCERKNVLTEYAEGEIIVRIPSRQIGNFPFVKKRYYQLIDDEISDADVVHLNCSKLLFRYFAKLKNKYKFRLVVTSHGWFYHTEKNKKIKDLYFKYVIAKYAPEYDGIINVSYQDQNIAESFGVSNSTVIMNGVNIYKYSKLPPKSEFLNRFITFGRIAPNKGIYECLTKLLEYDEPFTYSIVGLCEDKTYLKKLTDFILDNGLESKVKFSGKLSDYELRDEINQADMILMPSLHEGFGMALTECLLSGRPIIANRIESFTYILEHTQAQEYLFDYTDPDSCLKSKVEELKQKPINPVNVEEFSEDTMIKKTIEIYGVDVG